MLILKFRVSMVPKYLMFYQQGSYEYKQMGSSYSEQQIDSADKSLYMTVQSFLRGVFHKSTANLFYSYKTLVHLQENTCYYPSQITSGVI